MSSINYFTNEIKRNLVYNESLKENFEQVLRSKKETGVLRSANESEIKVVVIGPNHFGVLTKSGKIYRVRIKTKKTETDDKDGGKVKKDVSKTVDSQGGEVVSSYPPDQTATLLNMLDELTGIRRDRTDPIFNPMWTQSEYPNYSRVYRGRPREVPEEMINQVAAILQGHPRQAIEEELQRNNLNVTAAINVLLNEGDPNHRRFAPQPLFRPSDEPVIYINRDAHLPPTVTTPRITQSNPRDAQQERSTGQKRRMPTEENLNTSGSQDYCDIDMSTVEWLESSREYTLIGAMYSELIGIDVEGCIHSWKWDQPFNEPSIENHSGHTFHKAAKLRLDNERVVSLSTSFCRATAVLKSNKVVAWMDSVLWNVSQLEGVHHIGSEGKDSRIRSVHTNNIFSTCVLDNGTVWWWGILPYSLRKKRNGIKLIRKTIAEVSRRKKVVEGSLVTYHKPHSIHYGSLAYYFNGSVVKMGRLEDSNIIGDQAKFTQVTESEYKVAEIKNIKKRAKAAKQKQSKPPSHESSVEDIEEWQLSNVVFLNEKVDAVGVAVKIEKDNVLVDFDSHSPASTTPSNPDVRETCSLKNCHIININDLKVIDKRQRPSSLLPHCQQVPRKIAASTPGNNFSICTDLESIYVLSPNQAKDHIAVQVLNPGEKPGPIRRIHEVLNPILFSVHLGTVTMQLYRDTMILNIPPYGYFFLERDRMGVYRVINLPSLPAIQHFEISEATANSNYCLSVAVFNKLPRLRENSPINDMHLVKKFMIQQNCLHFLANLSKISASSYNNVHFENIKACLHDVTNRPDFRSLMTQQDINGLTPFLYAIKLRSYKFALCLLHHCVAIEDSAFFISAISPPSMSFLYNPVYMICVNESCTYTWSGDSHIQQDSYECRSCGVVGKLCCCIECASNCHRGHDIVRKTPMTTSYCDCWEKCVCQAVFSGDQYARRELFRELLSHRELLSNIGTGSDHLLLLIIKGIERNMRQYKAFTTVRKNANQPTNDQAEWAETKKAARVRIFGTPFDSAKKPNNFLRIALKELLQIKECIESLFMASFTLKPYQPFPHDSDPARFSLLCVQNSGKLYDCFVFNLFSKCSKSYSKALHMTLLNNFNESYSNPILTNFIRSCIRIYTTMISVMSPFLYSYVVSTLRVEKDVYYQCMQRILFFFEKYPITSACELAVSAASLISPLTQGPYNYNPCGFCYFTKMDQLIEYMAKIFSLAGYADDDKDKPKPPNTFPSRRADRDIIDNVMMDNTAGRNIFRLYSGDDIVEDHDDDIPDVEIEEDIELDDDDDDETDQENIFEELEQTFHRDNMFSQQIDNTYDVYTDENDDDVAEIFQHSSATSLAFEEDDNRRNALISFVQDSHNDLSSLSPSPLSSDSSDSQLGETTPAPVTRPQRTPDPERNNLAFNVINRTESRLRNDIRTSLEAIYNWSVRGSMPSEMRSDHLSHLRSSLHEHYQNEANPFGSVSYQNAIARTFMMISKLISELCLKYKLFPDAHVNKVLSANLGPIFQWLFYNVDSIESKVAYGSMSLVSGDTSVLPGRSDYSLSFNEEAGGTDQNSRNDRSRRRIDYLSTPAPDRNRVDFSCFLLSLERSYTQEHHGILPHLDMNGYRYLGYMLDAYMFYLLSFKSFSVGDTLNSFSHFQVLKKSETNYYSRNYFSRTISTLQNSHFSNQKLLLPIKEGLSIAVQPCMLKPTSDKKNLFGEPTPVIDKDIYTCSPYKTQPLFLETGDMNEFTVDKIMSASPQSVFTRWSSSIFIFSQIFADSVSCEPASIFPEFCRFSVKERTFKSFIEKSRSLQSTNLAFDNVDRGESKILCQTFKILNGIFAKIDPPAKTTSSPFNRIKVNFRNEPAEGVGVVRNFFSVVSLAIISSEKLPDLSNTLEHAGGEPTNTQPSDTRQTPALPLNRPPPTEWVGMSIPGTRSSRPQWIEANFSSFDRRVIRYRTSEQQLQPMPRTYDIDRITLNDIESMHSEPDTTSSKNLAAVLNVQLRKRVRQYTEELYNEIVEALLQLSPDSLFDCLKHEESLKSKIKYIKKLYQHINSNTNVNKQLAGFTLDLSIFPEDAPLFFQPGKGGFFFPVNAKKTPIRINAYRNVGRIIGLALYFSDLLPIVLCRPVIKYLLDRPLSFHDFAFYDPVQYESFRLLLLESEKYVAESNDPVAMHGLHFCLSVTDTDGMPHTVELINGGASIPVTSHNVANYIQLYTHYLMLDCVKKELKSMQEGVTDVIHPQSLSILNPEDFRLLLNGSYEISVADLKRVIRFSDENSGVSSDKISRFKRWFWEILESFTTMQRSNLLLFWTSSPMLNLNDINKPNITFKPCSDHLPTSNTCVLRMYLPVYKTKAILKSKLLTAIETKTFGFV